MGVFLKKVQPRASSWRRRNLPNANYSPKLFLQTRLWFHFQAFATFFGKNTDFIWVNDNRDSRTEFTRSVFAYHLLKIVYRPQYFNKLWTVSNSCFTFLRKLPIFMPRGGITITAFLKSCLLKCWIWEYPYNIQERQWYSSCYLLLTDM